MEKSLNKIITAILSGKDYRPFVLEAINRRFVDRVHEILISIFEARKRNTGPDWWRDELVNELRPKAISLWFSGLNEKTVRSMTGTSKKEVCVELGRRNLQSIQNLIDEISKDVVPQLEVIIRYKGENVKLSEGESILLMNAIATMKLAIQGGAWSEVGKKVEKPLLFTIFETLGIPHVQYILVFGKMVKEGHVGAREIDAIVFTDDRQRKLSVELKLLGANPEIGDEALARRVDLFLVDKLSPMMIQQGEEIGVTTIELRDKDVLNKIYNFFRERGVTVRKPNLTGVAEQIDEIIQRYDEEREKTAILQKVKELFE